MEQRGDIAVKNQLLHTPEGVRDIYNEACERKIILEGRLLSVLKSTATIRSRHRLLSFLIYLVKRLVPRLRGICTNFSTEKATHLFSARISHHPSRDVHPSII